MWIILLSSVSCWSGACANLAADFPNQGQRMRRHGRSHLASRARTQTTSWKNPPSGMGGSQAAGETPSKTAGEGTDGTHSGKQAALARQKELEDKYANSPLTREIIQTIRGGSNDLPEEIVVYDDRVTGCTNGVTRTYDFIANRVATLQRVYNCMLHYGDYELLLRPQVALGNAINRELGGEYDVSDEAVRRSEQHAHSDGEIFSFSLHLRSCSFAAEAENIFLIKED